MIRECSGNNAATAGTNIPWGVARPPGFAAGPSLLKFEAK